MAEIMLADLEYAKLRELPRTPNPFPETRILTVGEFECLVFYNYVDQGEYGMVPTNHWFGILRNSPKWYWICPLEKDVNSLEEACSMILPLFTAVVERFRKAKK